MRIGKVSLGATVVIKDLSNGNQSKYILVRPYESEVNLGKISIYSPVGKSLIGREVGHLVTIRVPGGIREFEILEIIYK